MTQSWQILPCFMQLSDLHWTTLNKWHPTPVLLPGKSHGRRSLVGCSPWGREELDTTERLHFHFSLSCIGEGNGNPLQCFCLENPRDGGAWWAAVYGVTQSRTRLKRLSSNSEQIGFNRTNPLLIQGHTACKWESEFDLSLFGSKVHVLNPYVIQYNKG